MGITTASHAKGNGANSRVGASIGLMLRAKPSLDADVPAYAGLRPSAGSRLTRLVRRQDALRSA